MKIRVKGYFNFKKAIRNLGISEIEMAGGTLRGLLDDLSDRFGEEFGGLDTELKEGDEIALFPPVAGG